MTSDTPDCLPNLPESIEADIVQGLSNEAPCTLPYRFISVQGPQALQALQGQVSCDLNTLKAGKLSYGTANTPKGRIYALFRITPWNDGFLICLSAELVEAFTSHIAKYLHFFKCDLKQEQDIQAVVVADDNLSKFDDTVAQWPLSLGQISRGQLSELWLAKQSVNESTNYWPAYQCSQGIAELFPETLEHFILQQLNLQELGAVSFKKGCYTGQEIIARMKFLGKQKKKTYILHSASAVAAIDKYPAKSKLYDAEGKVVGELVRIHPFQSGEHAQTHYIGLGLIDISHAESGELTYLDADASSAVTIFATNYK